MYLLLIDVKKQRCNELCSDSPLAVRYAKMQKGNPLVVSPALVIFLLSWY